MSIWVPSSYTNLNMLFVHSPLLPSSNSKISFTDKMVQNVNFLSINQNSNLSLKLNPLYQHKFMCMPGFQNRASATKILKFHTNRDNSAYLGKCNFQKKLVYQFWDLHLIHGIKTSWRVVLDPDFKSRLVLHVKWGKF